MENRRVIIDQDFDIPRTTAQQRRFSAIANFSPPLLRRAKATWLALARRHAPEKPLEGPVSLLVELYYHSCCVQDIDLKTTRPDLDNALKVIIDALAAAGWLRDDAQICAIDAMKFFTPEREHIIIKAEEIR